MSFLHADHDGRDSLACDLVEEFRASIAVRFVLSLLNRQEMHPDCFETREDHSVWLTRSEIRILLTEWQEYKRKEIYHPAFEEKMALGMLPYAQAILLMKTICGEQAAYQPFFRK